MFNQLDVLLVHRTQPPHYLQGPFGAKSGQVDDQANVVADEPGLSAHVSSAQLEHQEAADRTSADSPTSDTTDAFFAQVGGTVVVRESLDGLIKTAERDEDELGL